MTKVFKNVLFFSEGALVDIIKSSKTNDYLPDKKKETWSKKADKVTIIVDDRMTSCGTNDPYDPNKDSCYRHNCDSLIFKDWLLLYCLMCHFRPSKPLPKVYRQGRATVIMQNRDYEMMKKKLSINGRGGCKENERHMQIGIASNFTQAKINFPEVCTDCHAVSGGCYISSNYFHLQHKCENKLMKALKKEDMKQIIVVVEQNKIAPSKRYPTTFKALTNGKYEKLFSIMFMIMFSFHCVIYKAHRTAKSLVLGVVSQAIVKSL